MHKKMSKNEYRSKKETKVAARKVQDNSSRGVNVYFIKIKGVLVYIVLNFAGCLFIFY